MSNLIWAIAVLTLTPQLEADRPANGNRWITPEIEVEEDTWILTYFLISRDSTRDSAQVNLLTPSGVEAVFRAATHSTSVIELGSTTSDTIVQIVLKSHDKNPFKISAIKTSYKNGSRTVSVMDSPEFKPFNRSWSLTPVQSSVLTAVIAFIAGVSTHLFQKKYEARVTAKAKKREIEALFLKSLVKEIFEHKQSYNAVIAITPSLDHVLKVNGYNDLLGERGILLSAHDTSFRAYFEKIEGYYKVVNEFNRQLRICVENKGNSAMVEKLRSVARAQIKMIESFNLT